MRRRKGVRMGVEDSLQALRFPLSYGPCFTIPREVFTRLNLRKELKPELQRPNTLERMDVREIPRARRRRNHRH